ncbi:MAG TPA: AAA family ATPase [Candidatus Baltobacteraceae bacterium]|nr:AAA family ATPase [Candidatus Baltobacteraceae bacterium]
MKSPDDTLRVHLFKALRISFGGHEVRFAAPRKTQALLAYLLLNRAVALSRDAVAFDLWTDELETAARANLRRHVHLLTRALPSAQIPWILSGMKSIQWNPQAPAWVDAGTFEDACVTGEADSDTLRLYSGDLLADLDEEWLAPLRDRFREMYVAAALSALQRYQSAGRPREAIALAQELLRRDPLQEEAIRELLRARVETGDRAGAIQDYRKFELLLRAELGVTPDRETAAVFEAITRLPESPRQPAAVSPLVVPQRRTHFVDRDVELEVARDACRRSAGGSGGALLISGMSGIGKSSLLKTILTDAKADGFETITTTCFRYTRSPLAPLRDALALLSEALPDAFHAAPRLKEELSFFLDDPRARSHATKSLVTDQRSQFHMIALAIQTLSAAQPLVIAIEDIQWADLSTLECLRYVVGAIERARVIIALSYRSDAVTYQQPVATLIGALRRMEQVAELALEPLTDTEVRSMIDQAIGETLPSREIADRIILLAEGNPLFADELIGYAASGRGPAADPIETLPATLKAAVLERFDEFDDGDRTLLTQAAVFGRSFNSEFLAAVSETDPKHVASTLRRARDRQLVIPLRESRGSYEFRHALTQEVLYAELLPEEARILHRAAAIVLESATLASISASELAAHWLRANELEKAGHYFELAGDQAMQLFAHRDAVQNYSRAREFALSDDKTATLDDKLASAYLAGGDLARAKECLNRAIAHYEISDQGRLAELYLKMSVASGYGVEPGTALTWAQRALEQSSARGEARLSAEASLYLARISFMRGEPVDAIRYLRKMPRSALTAGSLRLQARRLLFLAVAQAELGRRPRAFANVEAARSILRGESDPAVLRDLYHNHAAISAWFGKMQASISTYHLAIENGRRALNSIYESYALASTAYMHMFADDVDVARSLLDQAIEVGRGDPHAAMLIAGAGIPIALRQQDDALLARVASVDALNAALASGDALFTSPIWTAFIEYYVSIGEIGRATELIHRLVAGAGCGIVVLQPAFLIASHGAADNVAAARTVLAAWGNQRDNVFGRGVLALFEAIAASRFEQANAVGFASEACAILADCEVRYFYALALEQAGRVAEALEIHRGMHNRRDAERLERRPPTRSTTRAKR